MSGCASTETLHTFLSLSAAIAVAVGRGFICALTVNNGIYCPGKNDYITTGDFMHPPLCICAFSRVSAQSLEA